MTQPPRHNWLEPVEGAIVAALLAIILCLAVFAAGCSFPQEGTGTGDDGQAEPLPRWPWMPLDAEDSGGSETAGESDGGTAGGSGSAEVSSGSWSADEGSSGWSGSSGEAGSDSGSESGAGGSTYGPCSTCTAPWACTSGPGWEACVLPCEVDEDCPDEGTCYASACFLPCPCSDGAECIEAAQVCGWPA